uniref:hypothetical protein n=1 Tax=Ndongobacter massiliensis TaxID=1871025 RepID=UPI0009309079|nr:hypothetical protein [Ndongobacter massiliensis]
MFQQKRLSRKMVYAVLGVVAVLVLVLCLEALFLTKDRTLFETWRAQVATELTVSDYAAVQVMTLLQTVLIPAGYALHLFFAVHKAGLLKIAYWVWGLLLFYVLFMQILQFQTGNLFWWVRCLLFFALFLLHCNLSYGVRVPQERMRSRKETF